MSIYPPNNTTPKSPSGNYLWNWLGSPLKKFAAALAPYLGGGGGDGYTYTEINISSAELINPPSIPPGYAYTDGIVLLPITGPTQYYEWKLNIEFIPGSTAYNNPSPMPLFNNQNQWEIKTTVISANVPAVWLLDSRTPIINAGSGDANPGDYVEDNQLILTWGPGLFTGGDGTLKVKLWYKLVNFG